MSRRTIYVGDYVAPVENLTISVSGGMAIGGWSPESDTAGEVVALEDGAATAVVKLLGGRTGHARKHEPDVPEFVRVPIGGIERVEVYLLPQRVPRGRTARRSENIAESIAKRERAFTS